MKLLNCAQYAEGKSGFAIEESKLKDIHDKEAKQRPKGETIKQPLDRAFSLNGVATEHVSSQSFCFIRKKLLCLEGGIGVVFCDPIMNAFMVFVDKIISQIGARR